MVITVQDGGNCNNSSSSSSLTATTTTTANTSVVRRPFEEVVREYTTKMGEVKAQSKPIQQVSSSDRHSLERIDDLTSYNELKQEMLNTQKSKTEQFLFACRNGSDDVTVKLLRHLLSSSGGSGGGEEEDLDLGNTMDSNSSNSRADEPPLDPLESAKQPTTNITARQLAKITDNSSSNCSLMHICALLNKPHAMELLVQYNVPIDSLDSISATPLHYAVAQNCMEAAAFLLSRGSNINAKDTYNKFPLLIALRNKHYKMAELLSSFHGIDIHLRGTRGNTVLHYMVEEGDLVATKFLVEQLSASPLRRNNEEENALFFSLSQPDIANYLASKFSMNGLTKMLLNANTFGSNLFHKCASDGYFDTLLLILKNLNIKELTTTQVHSLLNDTDKNGDTPLLLAVKNARVEYVQFLSQCLEVELNEGDKNGDTALYHAVAVKDQKLISILKSLGASLRATRNDGDGSEETTILIDCAKSLNTLLVIIFTLVAVVCTVTIAAVSLGFFGKSISKNAAEDRRNSFQTVLEFVDKNIRQHDMFLNTATAQANTFNVSDQKFVLEYSFNTFKANPRELLPFTINSYCGNSVGGLAGVQITNDNTYFLFDSLIDPFTNWNYYFDNIYNVTLNEVVTPENGESEHVNDVYGNLFTTVQRSNTTGWTNSYTSSTFAGNLLITLFKPFRESDTNSLLGYCAADIATEPLSTFLYQHSKKQGSSMVVVERSTGYLIGTSDPTIVLYEQGFSQNITRFNNSRGKNLKIDKMLSFARRNYGGFKFENIGTNVIYDSFRMGGKKYALNLGSYTDPYGIDWVLLQSVDFNVFYGGLHNSIIAVVCVTVGLLILSVISAFIAASLFMRPLKTLIEQAEAVKLLQLEQVEEQLNGNMSMFVEIKSLQKSFLSMASRLKQFRQFIPDHILAVIENEVLQKAIFIQEQKEKTDSSKTKISVHDIQMRSQGSVSDSRDTSVSSSLYQNSKRGFVTNALTTGLTSGSVTVMTIKFPDMTDLLEIYSALDVTETSKDMLNAMKECLRETNGQLVSVNSTHAIVVWNSFIPQHDHRGRGCKTALLCLDKVRALHRKWSQRNLPLLNVIIGLGSGTAFFGNIGSDATKFFTVMGKPATLASQLCELNEKWGTSILCSEELVERVKDDFHMRPIQTVENSGVAYELGEARHADDMWVHELGHSSDAMVGKDNKWFDYIQAYKLFEKNMYEEALNGFMKYLEEHPSDIVTQTLVQTCKQQTMEI